MPKETTFDTLQVLQRATSVFHKKGYHGSSMQDLVDATGLNRSSIYNSFGCKLQLYLRSLEHYRDLMDYKTSSLLSNSDDALQIVETILKFYVSEIILDTENKGCFIVNCKSEMGNQEFQITQFLLQNQENILSIFEKLIKKGQSEGTINTTNDAKSYALYLFTAIQGLRMTGILVKEKSELLVVINSIVQTLK